MYNLGLTLLGSFTNIGNTHFPGSPSANWITCVLEFTTRTTMGVRNIGGGSNPIATMLNHGYFFDDVYYALAKGIGKFSDGLKYADDSANLGLNSFAGWFVRASSKLKKVPSTTVQNYIAAGIVGLILIVVLLILTVGV